MRRSTALTFQMIKTSNRLNAMRGLGIGAGVLGAGALGALGLQYLPGADAAMAGGPSLADAAFGAGRAAKPVAEALSSAYGITDPIARPSSLADRAFGSVRAAKPVAEALSDAYNMAAPRMVFTEDEARAALGPGMADGAFGAIRAGRNAVGRLNSMMDISGTPPSMSDRVFGLGRAGAGAAGRLNDMMDISGSAPPSLSDRVFGLGRAGAGAAGRLGGIMDISSAPSGLLPTGRSLYDRIFDPNPIDLARS